MGIYLQECEVQEMQLRVPAEDVQALAAHFDGRSPGERGLASATLAANTMKLECGAGSLLLERHGGDYVARQLEVVDDREGEFLRQVVMNVFLVYGGRLHCQLHWSQPRTATNKLPDVVFAEDGRSNWAPDVEIGGWLSTAPKTAPKNAPRPAAASLPPSRQLPEAQREGVEGSAGFESSGGEVSEGMAAEEARIEEILAKVHEAERHYAEYLKLKRARGG